MSITTQQSVNPPSVGYPGDPWGTSVINQGLVQGGIATGGGVRIGTWCWGISGTNQVTQLKGANTQLGGLVIRSEANPIAWADIPNGASMMVSDGQDVNFVRGGTFLCNVTSLNAGGAILPNDKVYIRTVDGVTVVSTTTQTTGFYDTGWIVTNAAPGPIGYTITGTVVVISNQQTFD